MLSLSLRFYTENRIHCFLPQHDFFHSKFPHLTQYCTLTQSSHDTRLGRSVTCFYVITLSSLSLVRSWGFLTLNAHRAISLTQTSLLNYRVCIQHTHFPGISSVIHTKPASSSIFHISIKGNTLILQAQNLGVTLHTTSPSLTTWNPTPISPRGIL